jgi:hypothetical protein
MLLRGRGGVHSVVRKTGPSPATRPREGRNEITTSRLARKIQTSRLRAVLFPHPRDPGGSDAPIVAPEGGPMIPVVGLALSDPPPAAWSCSAGTRPRPSRRRRASGLLQGRGSRTRGLRRRWGTLAPDDSGNGRPVGNGRGQGGRARADSGPAGVSWAWSRLPVSSHRRR